MVRVPELAEKGRATAAALRAVAGALDLRVRDVHLVTGGTTRRKMVEIDLDFGTDAAARERARRTVMRRLDKLRHAGTADPERAWAVARNR